MIAPDDRGFTLGHGLFETVLWQDHRLVRLEAHLARLARGCAVLGMSTPDLAACRDAAEAAMAAERWPRRAAVRLTWSAGPGSRGLDPPGEPKPHLVVTAAAIRQPEGPARLVTAQVRRNDQSPASRLKSLSYLDNVLARTEARAAGADEALMLNTRGEVACASAANVFWIRHGVVCTPALDCGVLDGIVRAEVLAACGRLGVPHEEVRSLPRLVAGAPMFLTSSLIGVRTVAWLDGQVQPPSPIVEALARAVSPAWR
jgi:branched-chain amino acid aminotransferase/4-amino-4-deoxychorismate lyase